MCRGVVDYSTVIDYDLNFTYGEVNKEDNHTKYVLRELR